MVPEADQGPASKYSGQLVTKMIQTKASVSHGICIDDKLQVVTDNVKGRQEVSGGRRAGTTVLPGPGYHLGDHIFCAKELCEFASVLAQC